MTRDAFLNAIVVNSAIGGSTNAPIHLAAIARHMGVDLALQDWQDHGHKVPLLVNLMPAGEYLGEDYYHAGGVPAVVNQLMGQGMIREACADRHRAQHRRQLPGRGNRGRAGDPPLRPAAAEGRGLHRPVGQPVRHRDHEDQRDLRPNFARAISAIPMIRSAFEGKVVVFDGPEDYHARIDDPALEIDINTLLVMRGAGPIGYPGAAEVVNMRAPAYLLREGVRDLPCMGDGRQSGTSASPSILNASPEAAAGGGLALLRTGDRVRIDLERCTANVLLPEAELAARRAALEAAGGYAYPPSQTPWQAIQRSLVGQLESGAILEGAEQFQRIAQTSGLPRDNH